MTVQPARVTEPEFERMVAPLRAELHVHCYRMLGSVREADDAVRESLVRARRDFDKLADRSGLRLWIYRIATNHCLSLLETRCRRELPVNSSPGAALTDITWLEPYPDTELCGMAPDARYEAREAVELAFVAALQYLPGLQRAALVLRDVLGFSARETAELLEISVAAADSALRRGRAGVEARLPERSQRASHAMADDEIRDLARQYADAWEAGDVSAIVALLSADARYSMPPLPEWYAGRSAIREFPARRSAALSPALPAHLGQRPARFRHLSLGRGARSLRGGGVGRGRCARRAHRGSGLVPGSRALPRLRPARRAVRLRYRTRIADSAAAAPKLPALHRYRCAVRPVVAVSCRRRRPAVRASASGVPSRCTATATCR
ncbi:RNA polymerase subunit sigma-70 [Nocardia xishanensis]